LAICSKYTFITFNIFTPTTLKKRKKKTKENKKDQQISFCDKDSCLIKMICHRKIHVYNTSCKIYQTNKSVNFDV
jgi:hypothetical protein